MHLAYIWIVSHLSAKNYGNLWKFDEVPTKTNLLSFFLGHGVLYRLIVFVPICVLVLIVF